MRDTQLYRDLLGVSPPWRVVSVDMDTEAKTITVTVDLKSGALLSCPECGHQRCPVKDRRQRTWRHLDTCQYRTMVQVPVPRTERPDCGVKTVEPPWVVRYSRFTKGFEHRPSSAFSRCP